MIPKIELAVPFVHLNGSSRESLENNLSAAYAAVLEAMDTLRQCAPNGRDAYPKPGLMQRLEAQHRTRQEYLQAVADSLEAEAIALQEQGR